MNRDLILPSLNHLLLLTSLAKQSSKRAARRISPLLIATSMVAAQNLWFFTSPAQADKTDASGAICAIPGNDGSPTISGGQVNAYFPGTANANAGTTSITVGTGIGTTPSIKAGDLLLIIQMQGADIDSSNTGSYGDGTTSNNGLTGLPAHPADGTVNGNLATNFTAGNFEYAVASQVSGSTITLSSPLVNSYTNADFNTQGQKRFQVVRVPQYSNLTVSGRITATPWNGSAGGIVAIDVAGKLTFSGSGEINVDGQGFRGGGGRGLKGDDGTTPTLSPTDVVTSSTRTANASKGEGTAGTPKYLFDSASSTLITNSVEGYPSGSYSRGAPGNAGGGGTDDYPQTGTTAPDQYGNGRNTGGGGGSNGGQGGKGGYSWSTSKPYGGDGGASFASSASARRLVMGGGGGAGSTNDSTGSPGDGLASSGAAGGGMVLVRANSVGTGTINANGASPTNVPLVDASGGGGAGGSVLVISQSGTTTGLTINARGGQGGSNTGGGELPEHGPGGGGSGGIVYATTGANINLTGGAPGTTTNSSFGGATAGDGTASFISASPTDATTSISGASCLIQVAKSTSTPGPMSAPGTATYQITATNPIGAKRPTAQTVTLSDAGLPPGFTHIPAAITPVYSGGATGPASVFSTGTLTSPSWSNFTIPPGGSVSLTFTVNVAIGTASGTYNNSAFANARYTNSSANVSTVSASAAVVNSTYDGTVATNKAEDVTIDSGILQVEKTSVVAVDSDGSGGTTPLASQVATPGDILEYTIAVRNTSTTTAANGIVLTDPIPANSSYIPGSLQIATGANVGNKTDAGGDDQAELNGAQVIFRLGTNANSSTGGSLGTTAPTNTTSVKFRVRIADPLPTGTTQLSNQATVSGTNLGSTKSNDPGTAALGDPTVTRVGPRLRLVKRITGIKKSGSATLTKVNGYNDLAGDGNDNAVGWPGGASTYLLGAINGSQVPTPNPGIPAPKDEVEYTIYFLSDGAIDAGGVNLCDFVPDKQTFVSGSIQSNLGGTTTEIADGSGSGPSSGFYTSSFPGDCSGTNNNRGAVRLQIGTVTTTTGTPSSSYGFFRFRAKVD